MLSLVEEAVTRLPASLVWSLALDSTLDLQEYFIQEGTDMGLTCSPYAQSAVEAKLQGGDGVAEQRRRNHS